MVEGPGATRNGRKIIRALNCEVIDAEFQCNSKATDPSNLAHRYLADAFVVGKELFLIFATSIQIIRNGLDGHTCPSTSSDSHDVTDGEEETDEIALRLHFGMNGCLYVGDSSGRVNLPQWRQSEAPTLRLVFGNPIQQQRHPYHTEIAKKRKRSKSSSDESTIIDLTDNSNNKKVSMVIEARRTTITLVSANTARKKLSRLATCDVCSPEFNANHVYERLTFLAQSNMNLIISDAILDQGTFPGVGNIIKIEALHKAKVDPRRTVASLSPLLVRRVVAFCRQFSLAWLKDGRTPTKLVYNKTICGTCKNASVSMRKLGGGNLSSPVPDNGRHYMSRVTFWCTSCQPISEVESLSESNANLNPNEPTNIIRSDQYQVNAMGGVYCPQHGPTKVVIRRVRKPESTNFSRLFHTCKRKDCQFFVWADGHFPLCSCGKRAALKVSKTAHSGGRWFFSCAQGGGFMNGVKNGKQGNESSRGRGCKLFEWAEQTHLDRLGSSLTPLL